MRKLLFLAFLGFTFTAVSQSAVTTFLLIRHAEKIMDGTRDPDLSDAGRKRAK